MTHAFMYPRVTQIAPRAHSVPASWLATRPLSGVRGLANGLTASGAAMTGSSAVRSPARGS
jgi:hypothetical protein